MFNSTPFPISFLLPPKWVPKLPGFSLISGLLLMLFPALEMFLVFSTRLTKFQLWSHFLGNPPCPSSLV